MDKRSTSNNRQRKFSVLSFFPARYHDAKEASNSEWTSHRLIDCQVASDPSLNACRSSFLLFQGKSQTPSKENQCSEVWSSRKRTRGLDSAVSFGISCQAWLQDVERAALQIAARHHHLEFKTFDGWITDMTKKTPSGYRKSTHTSLKLEETQEDKAR